MNNPLLAISKRTRRTPFSRRVDAAGVKAYSVYNRMLLPALFESTEADYHHLKKHVQVWDVSCERQIEIRGAHAARLTQMLTPRDLSKQQIGQCYYTPMVDETGGMLNDPVTLKLADAHYWVSIADSDLLLWVKGLAHGFRLEVAVSEPDVSPLGVQGPKADELMARVFGEDVRNIRFFRFKTLSFQGHDLIVARSGYSKQGGFEIYLNDNTLGEPLWDALFAAGEDLQVRAGCPNLIERVEAGLLSYGNDMTHEHTPHECGLGRFCNTVEAIACVGRDALLRANTEGPKQQIRSLEIDGEEIPRCIEAWPLTADDKQVGQVTSATWSPDFNTNVALGMVAASHWQAGSVLQVHTPTGVRNVKVREKSFI